MPVGHGAGAAAGPPAPHAVPAPGSPWARLVFAGWVPAVAPAIARWRGAVPARREGEAA
ncbi:hypothetical protein [Amycolatopsis minnesotensis]|uniref:hypothetical protein n=1 Tax=Amycolatopsis minnesotensis TaxID=337894 RepID=UPI0031DD6783